MSTQYTFHNGFPIIITHIPAAQLGSDIVLLPDDGFVTITYSGSTTSRWIKLVVTALSDVILGGTIFKSSTTLRFNDNDQDVAALAPVWIADIMTMEPATQVWENDDINQIGNRIDIIQDAATTPVVRTYIVRGDGRQSSLARQPGELNLTAFRVT